MPRAESWRAVASSAAMTVACALLAASAPALIPGVADLTPLLLVAVAYSGLVAGARGAIVSVAIVAVESVGVVLVTAAGSGLPDAALFQLALALGSASAIGVLCAAANDRGSRERWTLRALNAQLRYVSVRDPLTALVNRRGFEDGLDRELARSARRNDRFAVLLADVDGLKVVNDEKGHAAGDAVLETFAQALRAHLRSSDIAARYGGDEFALLLPDADARSAEQVMSRALTTYRDLARRRATSAPEISYGIATFPQDATSVDALLAAADRRLYRRKNLTTASA